MSALSHLMTFRLALCALSLLVISGCSMVRVGYGHLDSVATWMAHDYFDLNSEQRDAFAQRFERLHTWHRHEQLPEYARFLEETQKRANRGLQAADMAWLLDGFRQRYTLIAARGAADAADLLATLSPEQIESFKQHLDKVNKKFLRDNHSGDSEIERRKVVEKRTLSRLRDWVGSLSNAQEAQVITLLQSMPLVDKLRHEDRLRAQREFLALLEQRKGDRKLFTQRLRHWLEHWEAGRGAEQAKLFDESWKKRAEIYAAIHRTLTAEQRNHLQHRLQDYIDDFRHLSEGRAGTAKPL